MNRFTFVHFDFLSRCSCNLDVAAPQLLQGIAVSYANVSIVVTFVVGISDVYRTYKRGPRILTYGTPNWIWQRLETAVLILISNSHLVRYDLVS